MTTDDGFDRTPSSYPATSNFDISTRVYLEAVSASGCAFDYWKMMMPDGSEERRNANPTSVLMSCDTEVTAYFDGDGGDPPPSPDDYQSLSAADAKKLIDQKRDLLVIDVREGQEYDSGHILCALNYPWNSGELSKRYIDLGDYQTTDIVLYSNSGFRSEAAADFLASKGFNSVHHISDGLNAWKSQNWETVASDCDCEECSLPPMAHAGIDQTVNEGERVALDGSGSADPVGSIVDYQWSQSAGAQDVALSDPGSISPSFTAPYIQEGGEALVFHLTVTNGQDVKDTDSVRIEVEWNNRAPVADAGSDQAVEPGSLVALDGSDSYDTDGTITAYTWSIVSANVPLSEFQLSSTSGAQITFTAPTESGYVNFKLTVKDSGGAKASDTVTINISNGDQQPGESLLTADAGADVIASPGQSVTLDGSASVAGDSRIVKYSWQQIEGPAVTLSGSTEFNPTYSSQKIASFSAPEIDTLHESLSFQLTVEDASGLKDTDVMSVRINSEAYTEDNQPPTADAGADQTVIPGDIVMLDGSGSSDPEGSIFSYQWLLLSGPESIVLSDASAVQPAFTAPGGNGSAVFQLTVMDDAGQTATDDVAVQWVNEPPVANAGADQSVLEQDPVTLDASGSSDTDDGIQAYQWEQVSGSAAALSDNTSVSPTLVAPPIDGASEDLVFRVTVFDYAGQSSSDEVTIRVNSNEISPESNAGPDQTVSEGDVVALDGSGASDPDGVIVTYQWIQLAGPPVALSDETTVRPEFTAPYIDQETRDLVFELKVTDNDGLEEADRVRITVEDIVNAPTAEVARNMTVFEGDQVIIDGSGSSDPDGSVVSYEWKQISGPSVQLTDRYAQSLEFTAPDLEAKSEILVFELLVKDDNGFKDTAQVNVKIYQQTIKPVADAGPDLEVDEGEMVVLDGSNSMDSDGSVERYQWRQLQGPAVELTEPSAKKPAFEAPEIDGGSQVLTFQLSVEDDNGLKSNDNVAVTVKGDSGSSSSTCFISTVRGK